MACFTGADRSFTMGLFKKSYLELFILHVCKQPVENCVWVTSMGVFLALWSTLTIIFLCAAELLVDKAMELKYIGGVYGGNVKPSPFLCLILKMLQIQPEKDIVVEFITQPDFKYVLSNWFLCKITIDLKLCWAL